MKLAHSSFVLAAVFAFSGLAFADPIVGYGVFALSGTVTGTLTGLDFYLNTSIPPDQTGIIVQPTLGMFSSLAAGTQETILDLTSANGVAPGSQFDFANWIKLTDGINLDATTIPINASIAVCVGNAFDHAGDQCRPNAHSPIILTQGGNGVSARVEVDGVAHYGTSTNDTPFVGLFNAPATRYATISSFLTAFDASGGIPDVSYTAQFTTTVVPEPRSLILTCLGLIGLLVVRGLRRNSMARVGGVEG